MPERRLIYVLGAVVALLLVMVVWDMVGDARRRSTPAADPLASADSVIVAPPANPETRTQAGSAQPAAQGDAGPGYLEQLARAEERRQIRASQRLTYLNEILAASADSVLHRWDNRIMNPVRVYLGHTSTVANFQPAFLDAVRDAFSRWEGAGIPVRFDLAADSSVAEVRVRWRVQFEIDRTGQTDVTWDTNGHHLSALITLATFNQLGQPMGANEIRVVALHEIGHLLGLDHSPDSTDLMYPVARVYDLSSRDIHSARLLYQLSPGSIR